MNNKMIPFNMPQVWGREYEYMRTAIEAGVCSGDGPFGKKCQSLLEEKLKVPKALLTTSCTHALEMMAMLLNIGPGDEVIVPAFTFVSTANAFALRQAKIVFCDIRPDTLNLDETQLEGLITSRTKAVVVVHYAGIACEMDEILAITKKHGVHLLEDNAHGIFGTYRGRSLGTFGSMACLSFHDTKNVTCGEGGALLINDPALVERAEIIREKGTDRSRFHRGMIDKYTWQDIGSSYVLSDLLAAFLLGQLEKWDEIKASRAQTWMYYQEHLREWADKLNFTIPTVPKECGNSYHLYYLITDGAKSQQELLNHLRDQKVYSVFHYLPLHLSKMGKAYGKVSCPVTESVSERLIRLPLYGKMEAEFSRRVVDAVKRFRSATSYSKVA